MDILQGYVEWHIANTIQSIALANNVGKMDIILLSTTVLFLLTGKLSVGTVLFLILKHAWHHRLS
jgi:hypothetical protein